MGIERTHWIIGAAAAAAAASFGGIAVSQGPAPDSEPQQKTADGIGPPVRSAPPAGEATPERTLGTAAPTAGQAHKGLAGPAEAAAAPSGISATAAAVCKPAVSGSGEAKFRNSAEHRAKGDWQNVAAGTYGGVWDWNTAASHAMSCRDNGFGPIQRRWTCTASAEPCEEVITCKPVYVEVEGASAKLQSGAEENAFNQWQHDAGNAHGTAYKYWSKASNRTSSCRHNGLGPLQRRWRCTARARPCE